MLFADNYEAWWACGMTQSNVLCTEIQRVWIYLGFFRWGRGIAFQIKRLWTEQAKKLWKLGGGSLSSKEKAILVSSISSVSVTRVKGHNMRWTWPKSSATQVSYFSWEHLTADYCRSRQKPGYRTVNLFSERMPKLNNRAGCRVRMLAWCLRDGHNQGSEFSHRLGWFFCNRKNTLHVE